MSKLISSAVSSFWVLGVIKRISASLIGIFFLAAGTLNSMHLKVTGCTMVVMKGAVDTLI